MDEWLVDISPNIAVVKVAENQDWAPRRWAVVGSSGFIGNAICENLESKGFKVDRLSAPRLSLDSERRNVKSIIDSARSYSEKERLAERLSQCDVVVNAAGLATPDGAEKDALFGANSLLPSVLFESAKLAKVGRFIHLSSAAVQGNRKAIDDTISYSPFSDYSYSKAFGEAALLSNYYEFNSLTELIVIRATSVQGVGRLTTQKLKKVSQSPFSSVAAPGSQPTVVSSLPGLVSFVRAVGLEKSSLNSLLLQPWEKVTVSQVLEAAGGKSPLILPRYLCMAFIGLAQQLSRFLPRISGPLRRLELMWFGQIQNSTQYADFFNDSSLVLEILRDE